jgi:hypothetical protein
MNTSGAANLSATSWRLVSFSRSISSVESCQKVTTESAPADMTVFSSVLRAKAHTFEIIRDFGMKDQLQEIMQYLILVIIHGGCAFFLLHIPQLDEAIGCRTEHLSILVNEVNS